MQNAPASLYHLQTFHAVATERSVARAAQRLQLSEVAVSGHIRALERHYGAPLFAVRHRRVYLTVEGAALYEDTERVFSLLGEANEASADNRGVERGQLALGASSTIANHLLPPVLGCFAQAHPDVRVTVAIGTGSRTLARVRDGEVPFGLVAAPASHPDLDLRPFATDEMVLIVLPEHPWAGEAALRTEALRGAPFLRREPGSSTRALVDSRLATVGVSIATAMELGSAEALKQAVLADVGVAWVPRLTVLRELAVGALVAVPVPGVDLRRPLSVAVPRGAPLSPLAEALVRLLRVANPLVIDAPDGGLPVSGSPADAASPAASPAV
jgi:LysR family transcriptional regulator, transcriptional activator of the cysJI operon